MAARSSLMLAAALFALPLFCEASSHLVVVRRGWHIDVGFPAAEIAPSLRFVASALPSARYLLFGFGDMHYLEARHKGVSTLGAALWPGRGIMLVTGLQGTAEQGFGAPHVIELTVSESQSLALQAFIANSFVTLRGSADVYEQGPYEGSVYYLAVPRYSALHTCNTWAAEALVAAAFKVHHRGVLFAGQLWPQVRRLAKSLPAAVAANSVAGSASEPSVAPDPLEPGLFEVIAH